MYEVVFNGRQAGAIGILYEIKEWVKHNPETNEMECRRELANKYDHVSNIRLAKPKYQLFMV